MLLTVVEIRRMYRRRQCKNTFNAGHPQTGKTSNNLTRCTGLIIQRGSIIKNIQPNRGTITQNHTYTTNKKYDMVEDSEVGQVGGVGKITYTKTRKTETKISIEKQTDGQEQRSYYEGDRTGSEGFDWFK